MEQKINTPKTFLGIELGSTRIKACLIDDTFSPLASGSCKWENHFENGFFTYSLEEIHKGLQSCFADLAQNVFSQYGQKLEIIGAMGISAMMHGYLAFDREDRLLVPFRTWRNTTTEKAAAKLSAQFGVNIPQRWSIAHLYQAMLDAEPHTPEIAHLTTLSGYIHFLLTGRWELGIGDASGMFPVKGTDYDGEMLEAFRRLAQEKGMPWDIGSILPKIRVAGEEGAYLTKAGATFLDPSGTLKCGVPVCPPEGDAGTGMVATNAVFPKTGNISAGTSIFAMLVLETPLQDFHPEIDLVTTPDGQPVAMVHCNNCCGELDAWVDLFGEFARLCGFPTDSSVLYETLYRHASQADADCGGVTACNYLSGEPVTGITQGHPFYIRTPQSKLSLANFMQAQLYGAVATLKWGMDILFQQEGVRAQQFQAHGGFLKVQGTTQQILADALDTPVCVCETAGEGGAWGMALLAAYMVNGGQKSLGSWLEEHVFCSMHASVLKPTKQGVSGFAAYMKRYKAALAIQKRLEDSQC